MKSNINCYCKPSSSDKDWSEWLIYHQSPIIFRLPSIALADYQNSMALHNIIITVIKLQDSLFIDYRKQLELKLV